MSYFMSSFLNMRRSSSAVKTWPVKAISPSSCTSCCFCVSSKLGSLLMSCVIMSNLGEL